MTQQKRARQQLTDWLAHPNELGKKPAHIVFVKSFPYRNMTHYIFKYKKNLLGSPWLLGVAGGYESETDNDGHYIFSEMQPYDPNTDEANAIEIIEKLRSFFMNMARQIVEANSET